ncbi:glycosyltransferase family 4 protein [Halalkalicoccus jeotgali]|uniref:Glycosyl transferase group 1 n=1 Tax=Halalkalicoccus jeotgali (strain DSM 18796 / CECT 7217 / JCM 14584 / KCTC 4019 / B3) TaxID=795797 RepID=D8J482_HALJB|nr:glycosyltransferase family 4 protein [Halalkalicoccus jeotgali]ADJ15474.1 glycosyl transferase group 1 [Halalkalicoccus jeotgali B3]ELY36117.1 group 1 glycosyl transferase [Halalkalicoccus jeotgali B3]
MTADNSVLVLANHSDAGRFERHYGPLADVAGETTLVCLNADADVENARTVVVPTVGHHLLGLFALSLRALYEGHRGEYDAVVSVSLFPYGCLALALKALYGYPAHLGIIGIDLDHHADAWYGVLPRWLFHRFDTLSVPGPTHVGKLLGLGHARERVFVLTNAVDVETYAPADDESVYDYIWVGRFSPEKDPLLFVEALAALDRAGEEFRAAMLGSGRLEDELRECIEADGLTESIDLPGWVDSPVEYYHRSRVFVSTSRRDALPLTLIEAMSTGLACVAPPVGSIPDVVEDDHNAVLLAERDPETVAATLRDLRADPRRTDRLGERATAVRTEFSLANAREDWRRILDVLLGTG